MQSGKLMFLQFVSSFVVLGKSANKTNQFQLTFLEVRSQK